MKTQILSDRIKNLIYSFLVLLLLTSTTMVHAAEKTSLITGKQIPSDLGNYIKMIYVYGMGIVGIVATIVIMVGGFVWLSSLGNASRINDAKEWIGAALSGLALALFSYTILWIINPDLVNLKPLDLKQVKLAEITPSTEAAVFGCCIKKDGSLCTDTTRTSCTGEDRFEESKCSNLANMCRGKIDIGLYDAQYMKCPPNIKYKCQDCINCVKLQGFVKTNQANGDYADASIAKPMFNVCQEMGNKNGTNCINNEAWPPNGDHKSLCHQNGTCMDVKPTGYNSSNPDYKILSDYANSMTQYGVSHVWEVASGGNTGRTEEQAKAEVDRCNSYAASNKTRLSCTYNPGATGDHFHVKK